MAATTLQKETSYVYIYACMQRRECNVDTVRRKELTQVDKSTIEGGTCMDGIYNLLHVMGLVDWLKQFQGASF